MKIVLKVTKSLLSFFCRISQPFVAFCKVAWSCKVIYGPMWPFMILYGLLWPFMAKYRSDYNCIIFSRGHRSKFIWSCSMSKKGARSFSTVYGAKALVRFWYQRRATLDQKPATLCIMIAFVWTLMRSGITGDGNHWLDLSARLLSATYALGAS